MFNDPELKLLRETLEILVQRHNDHISLLTQELETERSRYNELIHLVLASVGLSKPAEFSSESRETKWTTLPKASWGSVRDKLEERERERAHENWQKHIADIETQILEEEKES
jgi:hypothetical protein